MFKIKFALFFFLLVNGITSNAQVKMYYEDFLVGDIRIEDVTKISVTNFTGVEIDYIYKGYVLDASGKELIQLRSDILRQKRGMTDYQEIQIKGLKIIKKDIDLETFSGSLTFRSELVHPLDTFSIIAREEKQVILKDGIAVDEKGAVLVDPRLVDMEFRFRYDEKFELEDLFDKIRFNNKNPAAACLKLAYEIRQEGREIYSAAIPSLCLPPGESGLTEKQRQLLQVSANDYENRSKEHPVHVIYKLGERQSGSRKIENVAHTDFNADYSSYESKSTGLSFDFINNAVLEFFPAASNSVMIFDENDSVMEMGYTGYPKEAPDYFGINNPFGGTLRRVDINGGIQWAVYSQDNFTDDQWLGYLAHLNQVPAKNINTYAFKDLEIMVPSSRDNTINARPGFEYTIFMLMIKDGNRVVVFGTRYLSKRPENLNSKPEELELNTEKVLNSIAYHGVAFDFKFDEYGQLTALDLKPENEFVSLEQRQRNYEKWLRYKYVLFDWRNPKVLECYDEHRKVNFQKMDAFIQREEINEKAEVPRYTVVSPENQEYLKYDSFSWDSIGIQFIHRLDRTTLRTSTMKNYEHYYYDNAGKIGQFSQVAPGKPQTEYLEEYPNYLELLSTRLQINPVFGQNIVVSKLESEKIISEDLISAIVTYENSSVKKACREVLTFRSGDWDIFAPALKFNSNAWSAQSNCFLVNTGTNLFRFKIQGGFKMDIERFLDSIQIDGKKFEFLFDEQDNLKKVEIK